MESALFDARVLTPLITFLNDHGTRVEPFLDRVQIPIELVWTGGWITKKQAYDLTLDIVQKTRCSEIVFAAYQNFELHHIGPIAEAMASCRTVKESLEIACRLGSIAYEDSQYFLKVEADTTWFCFRDGDLASPGRQYVNDMALSVFAHLVRITADREWLPERMLIRGTPISRYRAVETFQNCSAQVHEHYSALAFPTRYLSRPLPWTNSTKDFNASNAWLFAPSGTAPIVDALYRLLASSFPYRKLPTLEQVSAMLGTSSATLKRHLSASGISYQHLLDRLRLEAACELLEEPQLSIYEIAIELGYSGTNNFVRGFRRMTGLTPGQYRSQVTGLGCQI